MKTLAAHLVLVTTLFGCQRGATVCPEPVAPAPTAVAGTTPTDAPARIVRQPVVRLTESGAWGGALQQAGIPEFTLYADGLVVFAQGEGETAVAMQAQLSPQETYALVDRVDQTLGTLPEMLGATNSLDGATASIGVTRHGRIYSVHMSWPDDDSAETTRAFREVRDLLQAWDRDGGEPWTPDELEIVLYRRDNLEGAVQPWPAELPPPPDGAREPRPRPLGGRSKTMIQQPIRYRVSGDLEASLNATLPDPKGQDGVAWNGSQWLVRHERVVPARTWFW